MGNQGNGHRRIRTAMAALGIAIAAGAAAAQSAPAHGATAPLASASHPVLQVEDPATGARWQLERDPAHPGGPGRWLMLGPDPQVGNRLLHQALTQPRPAIRAGDRLQVERHTPVVDELFAAVALSSAKAGERLTVRLVLGGRQLPARALGPGRAELDSQEAASATRPAGSGAGL
ncbi:MAG: hypothetical protein WCE75_10530 [Terracidiphilus sp.]